MHRLVALFIFLFCVMHAEAAIQISEFCPDTYQYNDADEYLVLSGTGSLDDIILSDGRGGFRFPVGTKINGSVIIARSGAAFEQTHAKYPDFEWLDHSPQVRNVISGDTLRMANVKDVLMLYKNGVLVQEVAWPDDVKPREGQIHYLENDTWDIRPLLIGQSRLSSAIFRNVSVTTFVSPDSSGEMFSHAMNRASYEVLLNVYEFSSPFMADSLIAVHERDVDVKIILEGGPVGGISSEEKEVIRKMTGKGIQVSLMVSEPDMPAPYRYNHAKYVVIDRSATLITSENFKYSGFPPAGMNGNRGWGVYLEDPSLAEYFRTVFTTDSQGKSVILYNGSPGNLETASFGKHAGEFMPGSFSGATVRPVIAPDTSNQIINLINSAEKSIEIEQAYITNETTSRLNPYLSAAINAARRGVHVRVMLDSYWFNVEDEKDNDEMVGLINRIGISEHIPLEARCADLAQIGVEKIHNKGVIVDDQHVLVSSINWNSVSPNFNREAGVIIDHPGVAGYFLEVFEDDWNASPETPPVSPDYLKISVAVIVIIILLLIYYRHREA